jgi:hypothetical protein
MVAGALRLPVSARHDADALSLAGFLEFAVTQSVADPIIVISRYTYRRTRAQYARYSSP